MIRNTFSMLEGIGQKTERRLWQEGVLTWKEFLDTGSLSFLSPERKGVFDIELHSAQGELEKRNAEYFAGALQKTEHWRLFDVFKEGAACLDIETNGFAPGRGGYATVVGIYDGCDYKCFIRGRNLSKDAVREELSRYKYLITFFGSAFDIPFLERTMGLRLNIPHFDLCFGARKLGIKGGLKKLEPMFGIERPVEVKGIASYDAVLLWIEAKRGSNEAIELLRLYNREDTVNLFPIAGILYGKLRTETGIDKYL